MASRPIQISMETELLRRIDRDPEARKKGRSAFIRSAVELYLRAKEKRSIDAEIRRGYGGEADRIAEELDPLIEAQEWPDPRRTSGGQFW